MNRLFLAILFIFSVLFSPATSLAKGSYATQSGGAGGSNPQTSMGGFADIDLAAEWAFAWADTGDGSWCAADKDSMAFEGARINPANNFWYWTYSCYGYGDEHLNYGFTIIVEGCPAPFELNASSQCEVMCPAGQQYDADLHMCAPEPDCDCDKQGNPIDITSGQKHRSLALYSGSGSFPLRFELHYNNLANMVRSPGGLGSDSAFPVTGVDFTSTFTSPFNGYDYDRDLDYSPPLPNLGSPATENIGNINRKWRNYYDRFLLAAFNQGKLDPEYIPPSIQLFRFDGDTEAYQYDTGTATYVPKNAYGSQITRLDDTHELAPGWQVVNEDNEIEFYDLNGRLLRITSPSGLSHNLTYDLATGINLESVADDFGHALQFYYEDSGDPTLLTRFIDPDGNEYSFSYTTRGLISLVSYPDQTPGNPNDNPVMEFLYQDTRFPDAITDILDENGDNTAHYEYDASGVALVSESAGGANSVDVAYNYGNNTRTVSNALGLQTIYHLNSDSLIAVVERVASASGLVSAATETTTYDSNNNRASIIDWEGNVTTYTRDARGLELSRTEAAGSPEARTITTTWHPTLRLPTQIVEPGKTTDLTYDANGNLLTRTETDATSTSVPYSTNGRTRTWTYTYYPQGVNGQFLMHTMDGPRTDVSDVTTYTYTAEGYVASITNPLNQTTQVTAYNARGLPLTMIDSNGVTTEMTYHPRGWLLSSTVKDPVGSNDAVTTYEYDNVGQMTKVTLPNGSFLSYEYDAAHRLTAISNNLAERQEYTLDAAGNITLENTRASGGSITRTQTQVYDELSRIHQTIGGANQLAQMTYDDNGNQTAMALDPSGLNQSTIQVFDALNRLTTVTDAASNDSSYVYDARDNLVSVTDQRGLTTSYTYDGLNNLIQLSSPDTGITVYTYDDAGNQLSQTDARSVVTNYSYDVLNRLTAVTYPTSSAENIAYTYDQPAGGYGTGRLTTLTDQTGSTAYVYDHRGNQLQTSVTIAGSAYTTSYGYDLADNLIQTTYPSGRIVNHQLDALGRTASVTTKQNAGGSTETVADNVSYLPFGPMQSLDYGNNLNLNLAIDQDYRISGLTVEDGAAVNPDILDLAYTQNAVDNITAITDAVEAAKSQSFSYDALNRLLSADGAYGLQDYSYDPVGNRLTLSVTQDSTTTLETYTYDTASNRLLSVDVDGDLRTLQYDSNGNIIGDDRGSDTGFTLQYNNQNRLIEATPEGVQP